MMKKNLVVKLKNQGQLNTGLLKNFYMQRLLVWICLLLFISTVGIAIAFKWFWVLAGYAIGFVLVVLFALGAAALDKEK
jgi:hypothetical protein